MATQVDIDRAARSDEELVRAGVAPSPLADSRHVLGELVEHITPEMQRLAARNLRRTRPRGWKALLEAMELPTGEKLTRWRDNPNTAAVCLAEAYADEKAADSARKTSQAAPDPQPATAPARRKRTPRTPRPNWGWQDDAACRGEDLVLFFGPDGERQPQKDIRERKAKAICAQCPVRNECLSYALDRPEKYGVYGGLNEDERVSVRRRLQRTGVLSTVARPRPRVTVTEKRCCRCQELLPADVFYADNRATDGLTSACRGCQHAGERQVRRDAREAVAS